MLRVIREDDADHEAAIAALCDRSRAADPAVEAAVRPILADVRARGDAALREWSARLDGRAPDRIEIDAGARVREAARVVPDVRAAIERAAARVRAFHEEAARRAERSWEIEAEGVRAGMRVEPIGRAGLYVPGGKARYPSTVLMTAIPARAAGVREVVMCTPGPSPETLLAAEVAGVDRVFAAGGAQAVAAMAYGTATVPRCDKVVGPGNAYVTCAKRLVFGDADIDGVAGPSELLVVADAGGDPEWIAADLCAQAEHDEDARVALVTPSADLAERVAAACARLCAEAPRRAVIETALARGAAVLVASLDEAAALCDRFAPEHLEVHVADPRAFAARVRCVGAALIGPYAPAPVGDYLAGPSHVLPTAGSARFSSPLGVHSFLRRTSIVEYRAGALAAQAGDIARLAEVEGLPAHARAVTVRDRTR